MSWYKMHRGWQSHKAFSDEPYTEREAWEWLISKASWDGKTEFNILGKPEILPRGQLSFAMSYLAKAWQWNKTKVMRFLKRIAEWGLIETQMERGQCIVSICEYDKYQGGEDENETREKRKRNAKQPENETNKKNLRTKELLFLGVSEDLWTKFKKHRGKKFTEEAEEMAVRKLERLSASGNDPTSVIVQSLENNWQGLFELRKENERNSKNNNGTNGKFETGRRSVADAFLQKYGPEDGENTGSISYEKL